MASTDWKELRSTLKIVRCCPDMRLKKPTATSTKEFEKASGIQLPRAYKEFIRVFGPGELAWEYRFVAPGYKSQVANVDLMNFNSEIQRLYTKDALKRYTDPERVRRMLYFSASSAGDLIGWDPVEITNPDNCEYAIYIVGGRNSPRKLVGSFAEFINKVCLAPENLDIPGRDPSLPTRRMFQEACDTSGL